MYESVMSSDVVIILAFVEIHHLVLGTAEKDDARASVLQDEVVIDLDLVSCHHYHRNRG